MRREFAIAIQLVTLGLSQILSGSLAAAQNPAPPTLEEQLKAQYQVAETRFDSGQVAIVKPGTILAVQKAGIRGFPPEKVAWCPSTYKDGNLKGPGAFCLGISGGQENTRLFQVEEKVYPTKIDVKVGKEKISFFLIDCDSCNGVDPPSFYKSEVVFQFPKGYLETASAPQVEDTIGQVLTIAESGDQGQQQAQASQPVQQTPEQAQAPPPAVQLVGQTQDQVTAIFGQPQQIVNAGPKQIYIYKDLRVTFLNGKATDIQ